jgi:hypothetical protein
MTGQQSSSGAIQEKRKSGKVVGSGVSKVEVKQVENQKNFSEINSKNKDSSPVSRIDQYQNEKFDADSSNTNDWSTSKTNKSDFKKNSSSTEQKTYEDYHNDKTFDSQKKAVKFDENQPFPQFSLNVSNPISWKLMLLIMLMQLLTNIMLVIVLYLK